MRGIMGEYDDFEMAMSASRSRRYLVACLQSRERALKLYRANIRLSGKFLQVVCIVEIALRNAINRHYLGIYKSDWIVSQTNPGGYLAKLGCEHSRANAQKAINASGEYYSHDQTVAELNFGFWSYAFGAKEFPAAGSTLLRIFPKRPHNTNRADVFEKLRQINDVRNRIAHHDSLCFEGEKISTWKVESAYHHATDLLAWLGLDKTVFLKDIDFVMEEIQYIAGIRLV